MAGRGIGVCLNRNHGMARRRENGIKRAKRRAVYDGQQVVHSFGERHMVVVT